ncbi:MAG: hypothetical protein HRU20_21550 [Pseudomonadales bacterium]|nr:hypothetical protein [Pseudomonadales bacterium]
MFGASGTQAAKNTLLATIAKNLLFSGDYRINLFILRIKIIQQASKADLDRFNLVAGCRLS